MEDIFRGRRRDTVSRSISISRCHEPHTWRLLRLRPRALNSFVSLNWIDPVPPPPRRSGLISRRVAMHMQFCLDQREMGGEGRGKISSSMGRELSRGYSWLIVVNEPSSPDKRIMDWEGATPENREFKVLSIRSGIQLPRKPNNRGDAPSIGSSIRKGYKGGWREREGTRRRGNTRSVFRFRKLSRDAAR